MDWVIYQCTFSSRGLEVHFEWYTILLLEKSIRTPYYCHKTTLLRTENCCLPPSLSNIYTVYIYPFVYPLGLHLENPRVFSRKGKRSRKTKEGSMVTICGEVCVLLLGLSLD